MTTKTKQTNFFSLYNTKRSIIIDYPLENPLRQKTVRLTHFTSILAQLRAALREINARYWQDSHFTERNANKDPSAKYKTKLEVFFDRELPFQIE